MKDPSDSINPLDNLLPVSLTRWSAWHRLRVTELRATDQGGNQFICKQAQHLSLNLLICLFNNKKHLHFKIHSILLWETRNDWVYKYLVWVSYGVSEAWSAWHRQLCLRPCRWAVHPDQQSECWRETPQNPYCSLHSADSASGRSGIHWIPPYQTPVTNKWIPFNTQAREAKTSNKKWNKHN